VTLSEKQDKTTKKNMTTTVDTGTAARAVLQTLPVVSSVEYPLLKKLGKANIRMFLRDRDAYVREIKERKDQEGQVIGKPVSLTFSIEASLIESLVDLRQFGSTIDTVAKVTDVHVQAWLDKHREVNPESLSATQVHALVVKNLRINLSEKDAEQRIIMLFAEYSSLLRVNGLSWLLEKNPKVAVGHIIEALKPIRLQKRIKDDLSLAHVALEKDFLQFMQHVIKRAEIYNDAEDLAPPQSNKPVGTQNSPPGKSGNKQTSSKPKFGSSAGTVASATQTPSGNAAKTLPECLNPSCREKHYLKHCGNTSQELKDKLYAERAEARKASGEQRSTRSDGPQNPTPRTGAKALVTDSSSRDGSLPISLGPNCMARALLDLGADDNVLPASMIDELQAKGSFVSVRWLPTPIKVDLAVKGPDISIQVNRQARLTVELQLAAGPLRLRNVCWLIAEKEMDEVLLGRPLLKSLGIDAASHLEAVREKYNDMDCAAITSAHTGGKLSRMLINRPEAADAPAELMDNLESKDGPGPPLVTQSTTPTTEGSFGAVRHGDVDNDPVNLPHLLDMPLTTDAEEVDEALEALVTNAAANGLPAEHIEEIRKLVHEFHDVWRISLAAGPPAKLPPMVIKLRPDATPVRCKLRRYPPEQRAFLASFVDRLVANGLAYRNPHSTWCSAPLLVAKPGPSQFRFTVDLRPVNKLTVPHTWPMPHLESELALVHGSKCFASFDLSNGYWQLELAADSQECQSFITPDGVFTPTRVLHGTSNAVAHMQAAVQGFLGPLVDHVLAWLDDLLMHAKSVAELLKYLRVFFSLCRVHNLKLHPGKCTLYSLEVHWCGRLISDVGVRFDPRRIQGLKEMATPRTGADLQQFVCALNWMRTAIPAFSKMVAPLQQLLETVYSLAGGKRTRAAAVKIPLSRVGWGQTHADAFSSCQSALEHAATLAHISDSKRICLYTDASDEFWSSITTQVSASDLDLPSVSQSHEPLAFLSGTFTGAQKRWPIVEKEAFAILVSCERLSWMLQRPDGFSLYTDHRNLIYIFNPHGANPGLASHTAAKLIRWALRLSCFRYTIEYVPGAENVWSDMLTRWAAPCPRARMCALMLAPLSPALNRDFIWPTLAEIKRIQDAVIMVEPTPMQLTTDGVYKTVDGRVWIPNDATDVQLRICIVAHAGLGGHRGTRPTTEAIAAVFYWDTLQEDVKQFCNTCLHCQCTLGGERQPRPWGEALHAEKPNEILHMDFLYMGNSELGYKYLLLLKDDLSGYLWLVPCEAANAAATVNALMLWFAAFGVVSMWVSDRGAHFKNQVVEGMRQALRSQQHFTTAYTPWANGTI
jgi:RNase H-like domain found in reverse transcriptase/Reverse transcriptase (RNA-dependent DNA polymerase)/Integrase zinc binding domain